MTDASATATPTASSAADDAEQRAARPRLATSSLFAFAPALLLVLVAMWISHAALGVNLGLFFAGVFVAALVAPPLIVAEETPAARAMAGVGVVLGISLVWLYASLHESITLGDVLACAAVVAAFVLCLGALAVAFQSFVRLPPAVAAFVVILLALAWLTWPVWLSPWIAGRDVLVARLAPAHPLLSINAVLRHLGLWDEQRHAYQMTALVRDVSYAPPAGGGWAVAFHGMVGASLIALPPALSALRKRRRNDDIILE